MNEYAVNGISPVFISMIARAIELMVRAGMDDVLIACVIQDIRSQTLNEEHLRRERLTVNNPPHHNTIGEITEAMNAHGHLKSIKEEVERHAGGDILT